MAKSKKNKSKTSSNKTSVAVRRSPRVERGPPNAAEALEDEAAIDIMITAEKLADQNDQHDSDTAVDGMYTEVDPPLVTPKVRKGSLRPGGSTSLASAPSSLKSRRNDGTRSPLGSPLSPPRSARGLRVLGICLEPKYRHEHGRI